jgi:hypothetical protein
MMRVSEKVVGRSHVGRVHGLMIIGWDGGRAIGTDWCTGSGCKECGLPIAIATTSIGDCYRVTVTFLMMMHRLVHRQWAQGVVCRGSRAIRNRNVKKRSLGFCALQ